MPGPVSDSYDPEWGTAANAHEIREQLAALHTDVSDILCGRAPMWVLDLVRAELPAPVTATLSERQWRLIRFALERAGDSI